ncbi:hypothetical protein FA15DRAFT_661678 [Coprinopsis marcescibilis]|uniref:Uncharacterized protein n=1 Tax=Coprinopsis marcescibilis TaxID=230819 RepID=A0A5C3KAK8_COPMA|nr:hypothetical protein FA15DRAFT_661678 [Coprinopsis marcescibilis]
MGWRSSTISKSSSPLKPGLSPPQGVQNRSLAVLRGEFVGQTNDVHATLANADSANDTKNLPPLFHNYLKTPERAAISITQKVEYGLILFSQVLFSSLSYAGAMLIAASLGGYVCYTLYCSRASLKEAGAEVQNLRSTSLWFSLLAGVIFFVTGTSKVFDVSRSALKFVGGVRFFVQKDILVAWLGVLRRRSVSFYIQPKLLRDNLSTHLPYHTVYHSLKAQSGPGQAPQHSTPDNLYRVESNPNWFEMLHGLISVQSDRPGHKPYWENRYCAIQATATAFQDKTMWVKIPPPSAPSGKTPLDRLSAPGWHLWV